MRVSLFIDGANFFYMQKDSLCWWADPKKILDFVSTKGDIVDAFYYIGVEAPPAARQENYLKALTNMGYVIVDKTLKQILQNDGSVKQKANLDIEIVLDMFNTIEQKLANSNQIHYQHFHKTHQTFVIFEAEFLSYK